LKLRVDLLAPSLITARVDERIDCRGTGRLAFLRRRQSRLGSFRLSNLGLFGQF